MAEKCTLHWWNFEIWKPNKDGPYFCTVSEPTTIMVKGVKTHAERRKVIYLYWDTVRRTFATTDGKVVWPVMSGYNYRIVAWAEPPAPYTDDADLVNKRDIHGRPSFNSIEYVYREV